MGQNITKIIILAGAPGTGKTTLSTKLQQHLPDSARVELSWIRGFHLDNTWSQASDVEEQMSFDNLVYILNNYITHAYPYVIVSDLLDHRVREIPQLFDRTNFLIFTLVVHDEAELTRRVLDDTRDSGYRNVQAALAWNRQIMSRNTILNEYTIDNSHRHPDATCTQIIRQIHAIP